ncbi:ParB/RepB/Spo0J family partition protein [Patescibacteria group bacterium]|nr:ParB/RepB/Spo0J family partition protein [Patescibacteria group bacterium]
MIFELIPLEKIRISDLNIRANEPFGDEEDEEFVKNIETLGILEPIIVRPIGDFYEVDVGRRRFLSAQKLEYKEIPCIVREASNEESMDASISENIFRKNVDPVTLGRWIKMRLSIGDISLSQYARKIGKSKSTLSEWIRMTDLSDEMQREVQSGAVSFHNALKVVRMNLTPEEEGDLAEESRTGGPDSFNQALSRISAGRETRGAPKGLLIVRINFGKKSPDYNDLNRLAKAENKEIGEYCQQILIDHIKASK